jgi:hypothetical protein
MRGLAESGQANIAEVQSQAAYGETLSGLYGQKQAVEQQAVTQSQLIEQSVAAATTEANIQRGQQQLQSDQQLFNEVQAIEDNKKAQIAQLAQLADTGEYSASRIRNLAEAYGITDEDLTIVLNASTYFDPTGDIKMQERWNWEEFFTLVGASTAAGATAGTIAGAPGLGTGIGAIIGFVSGVISGAAQNLSSTMTVSGGGQEFSGTSAQVINQVNNFYAGKEGSEAISAAIDTSFTGTADKVVFKYRGQTFSTYNEALKAYRDSQ